MTSDDRPDRARGGYADGPLAPGRPPRRAVVALVAALLGVLTVGASAGDEPPCACIEPPSAP